MHHFCESGRHSYFLMLLALSLPFSSACATKPNDAHPVPTSDVVSAALAGGPTPAVTVDPDLPADLQNYGKFDPAATLDPKAIQESDFYQINKSTLDDKAKLDAAWAEQDRLESSVKNHKKETDDAQQKKAQEESDAIERDRQLKVENTKKNKSTEDDEQKKAAEEVKKMPTISEDELNWKALDHH